MDLKKSIYMNDGGAAHGAPKLRTLTLLTNMLARPKNSVHSVQLAATGFTLIEAAREGLVEVVTDLLKTGQASPADVDDEGYSALHHAARYNQSDVIKILLNNNADVNVQGGPDSVSPLHLACRYNNNTATQLLISQLADVNVVDNRGKSPLHLATRRGHDVIVKLLLCVTSVNVKANDRDHSTPLHMASIQGNIQVVESLTSRGAQVDAFDINGMTPLMWAASEGHVEVAEFLMKLARKQRLRGYLSKTDNEGANVLHLAVQGGCLAMCELIMQHGVYLVNSVKDTMTTPLHIAATSGYTEIARLLIDWGADVDPHDVNLMTPAHRASMYNRVDVLKLLVANAANINAQDKNNMCPLHTACWKGQTEVVGFLLDNGAQIAQVDSSLKTTLHWVVQYGHVPALQRLLDHSGGNLIKSADKNDQTVLHYAASTGNVKVLKMLLDTGARTDAKDQDERTALHIAALCNRFECVEALVRASCHEVNDADMDGRTPLHLASMRGHNRVAQVLIQLGADLSRKDEDHCTPLMLAAARGHLQVLKTLIDNHTHVNELDKLRNTALHYACSGGHTQVVLTLLEKNADVSILNTHDQLPLDLAIDKVHKEVAIAMMKHKTWRTNVSVYSQHGLTVLDRLIARVPDAAEIVLNHCIERTGRQQDEDHCLVSSDESQITYDFQYLDPGPNHPACAKKRYFALNTMVQHQRNQLLSHPLCQRILSYKWNRFGRRTLSLNVGIYMGYLLFLTIFVSEWAKLSNTNETCLSHLHNYSDLNNASYHDNSTRAAKSLQEFLTPCGFIYGVGFLLTVMVVAFFFRECFKMFQQRWRYWISIFNLIALVLICSTMAFVWAVSYGQRDTQRRLGWIALFLAWINFIMYLRRIERVGIYVIMFVTVMASMLKAVVVYFFFSWAFAGSFLVLMPDEAGFRNLGISLIQTFVMTLGEIDIDKFIRQDQPFEVDIHILLVVFLFIMPIVLMNLMIGLAVGDIDKIQRNAYLKRLSLQVELLYQLESMMPRFVQKKVHIRRITIRPTAPGPSIWSRCWRFFQSSQGGGKAFINLEEQGDWNRAMSTLDSIVRELESTQKRLKMLDTQLTHQGRMLENMQHQSDPKIMPSPTRAHRRSMSVTSTNTNTSYSSALDGSEASDYDNLPVIVTDTRM